MIEVAAVSSTPQTTFASTPNSTPSAPETEVNPDCRFLRQQAEGFIDRIMEQKYTTPDRIKGYRYTIPVRRPSETEVVCAAPPEKLRTNGWPMVADPATGEIYLVAPYVLRQSGRALLDVCVWVGFALAVSAKGASFLWPYPRNIARTLSAETAVDEARKGWVRVGFDKESGDYHPNSQTGTFPKPRWPKLEHDDVVDIVFADREIYLLDDPVLMRLEGEVNA